MSKYFRLSRVKHYIKNALILFPLFFNKQLLNIDLLWHCILGVASFSLISSAVYIFNDIRDLESDRLHSEKCKRPIASGEISIKQAYILFFGLLLFVIIINTLNTIYSKNIIYTSLILLIYFILNIFYSIKLKHIPIVDVSILALGFFLRLLFGSVIAGTGISSWMYLTIICASFYFALGKRRNELSNESEKSRAVLNAYTYNFLDKFMYLCLTLTLVFYSLWVIVGTQDSQDYILKATIPLAIIICMRYSLIIEGSSSGDPVEVMLSDNILKVLAILFVVLSVVELYVFA